MLLNIGCVNRIITIDWQVVYDRALEDIECDGFRERIPGLSPKEHLAMMDKEAQLRWQAEREDADKRWRHQERLWRIAELLVLVFGGVVAAVVGALIARS